MSLILEALRKSEAERRRGESPDLYAELPPLARAAPRSTSSGWWLALAAVAVIAGLVWWLSRSPTAEPVANTAGEVASRERSVAPATPRLEPPAAIESPAAAAAPTPDPVPAPATATAPTAQPDAAAPTAAVADRQARDEEQGEEVGTKPPAVATDSPPAPVPPPLPAPPPIVVPEPVPPAPPVAAAGNDGLLLLADLPVAERKQLPPLKMSMHMWNDAPAQRFVIIDGQRLSEGGRIGDAVLVAIRTDGVVLDWNGRRLKLPIR